MKILVTDCSSRKALCVIRSLGKKGYEVIGVSHERVNMGRFSKYCSKFYKLPNPLIETNKFISKLVVLIKGENVDILVPMEDETVELIIKNNSLFRNISTLLPSYETFMIARDKRRTIEKAIEIGIPCPHTYFINDIREVSELENEITYPTIVKARISSGSRGLVRVNDKKDLVKKYNEVHEEYKLPIIQQYITGDYEKIQVLLISDKNYKVKAICTYQGIREFPVDGGPVTMWKTTSFPEIEKKTIEFIEELKWVGFAEVEYIVDKVTGDYYLMEVNPRFSANIALAVNIGIDFPLLYYKLAQNQNTEFIKNEKFNEYCQWLLPGDLLNFVFNRDRFRQQEVGYFCNKPKNIHYAILSKDDFFPVIGAIFSMIFNIVGSLKNLKSKLRSNK